MTRHLLLYFFITLISLASFADRCPIVIQNGGQVETHFELPVPADQPTGTQPPHPLCVLIGWR